MQDRSSFALLRSEGVVSRGSVGWIRRVDCPRDRIELAFAIGKRVGPAVERNRLRRRIRAIFAHLVGTGQLRPGIYLVGVNPFASTCTFSELTMELSALLDRFASANGSHADHRLPTDSAIGTRQARDDQSDPQAMRNNRS